VSASSAALPAPLAVIATRVRRLRDALLGIRTAYVLGALLVVQWIAVLALALTVRHNGWLYYAGGDQLWHYTGAYLLGHGDLPPSFVGYGWSILLLPIAPLAGPNLVSALPALVLFNTLVLLPIALLCIYGIASRIAGRVFGYWAAALWIAVPYVGIVFVEPGYHQKYTELTLPQVVGLTSVPDFPATVALLISAYLCLRTLDRAGWHAAAGAGLAAGYSIAIKPSNSIFLIAPLVVFVVERWRSLLPFALGLAPALVTLALWKYRGLGQLGAAPTEPVRLAGGVGDLLDRIHRPSELNSWEHLDQVLLALREHFWVARVMEWLPVAGVIALLARSRRGFLLVGGWFTAYLLVKGTYIPASVEDASFWRILMPAFPAYVILAAAVVLLMPGVRIRPARTTQGLKGGKATVAFSASLAIFALAPLAVIAAVPPLHDAGGQAVRSGNSLIPVSSELAPRAGVREGAVTLSWQHRPAAAGAVFYRVLRAGPTDDGLACGGTPDRVADDCRLFMEEIAASRGTSYVDEPGPGTWSYRIGLSANWLNDFGYGDIYVVSPPITITVD
jgi:hypothetical protein